MTNQDETVLERASPFIEIPAYSTLTSDHIRYVQNVARGIDEKYWAGFTEIFGEPLREVAPIDADLEEVRQVLNKSRRCAVFSHRQPYYVSYCKGRNIMEKSKVDANATYPESSYGINILVVENGGLLYFSYTNNESALSDTLQTKALYEAGIPVLMSDLLTFHPLRSGQEVINTRTRKRMGDGVSPSERNTFIVLKLPEPDKEGNMILQQSVDDTL